MSRFRAKARAAALAAFNASTIVPFTATMEEGVAEGTAIGIVGLSGTYVGAMTWALIDDVGGRVKLGGADQLQAGATPTDFAVHPTLSPIVEGTAVSGGAKKRATISIEVLDTGAEPAAGMVPSATWNGTPGSGFDVTPTATTQADLTTAGKTAPKMRLLQPDHLHFGEGAKLRVRAECFGGVGAIDKVECLFEGNVYEGDGPKVCTEPDPRGVGPDLKFIGYEWTVNRSELTATGDFNVYFKATPVSAAILPRTIGPFKYYKYDYAYASGVHDADIEVGTGLPTVAGVSYPTVTAALSYCRSSAKQNPRITISVTGSYTLSSVGVYAAKGRALIRAADGVTATFANTSNGLMRTRYDALHFYGPGIVIDLWKVSQFYHESTGNPLHVLEGCVVTNSDGPIPLYNGSTYSTGPFRNGAWYIGMDFTNHGNGPQGGPLARNCYVEGCSSDIFSNVRCVVSNSGVDNKNYAYRRTDQSALTLAYTGAGPATFAKLNSAGGTDDTQDVTSHIFRLTDPVNGTVDFPLSSTYYTIPALAAAIDALPDWTATANAPYSERRSAALTLAGVSSRAGTWAARSITATPVEIATAFELHADWYQTPQGVIDNVIIGENTGIGSDCTYIRVATSCFEVVICNNAFHASPDETFSSTYGSPTQTGILVWHNTIANQSTNINSGRATTAFSEFYGNCFSTLNNDGTGDQNIEYNHVMGSAPTGGANTTSGGTMATLLIDAPGGDFQPQGDLLSNLITPKVAWDANCDARGATDARGAVRVPV